MTADSVSAPEPLAASHDVSEFDCGVASLNDYLVRRALQDQNSDKSRTFVIARDEYVVGYFSIAAASVERESASARSAKGQGAQPIPAILLGRFAVDTAFQRRGFGEAMLIEALAKCAHAADTIGARVVLVHAVDGRARSFYLKYGFEPSPTNPLHLMLLMKDVRKTLASD